MRERENIKNDRKRLKNTERGGERTMIERERARIPRLNVTL